MNESTEKVIVLIQKCIMIYFGTQKYFYLGSYNIVKFYFKIIFLYIKIFDKKV